jgi:hypothetical protein
MNLSKLEAYLFAINIIHFRSKSSIVSNAVFAGLQ